MLKKQKKKIVYPDYSYTDIFNRSKYITAIPTILCQKHGINNFI